MKLRAAALMLLLTASGMLSPLHAGSGNRTGTSGATELTIPTGTRDIAMGGATVATASGVEALFWNPAGAAKISSTVSIFASHMQYIADIGVNCAALSVEVAPLGVLSLYLKALSVGNIPITTVATPDGTGATFRPQFFNIGLTYSRQLTDRISVGVTGTVISEQMADVGATGFAFTFGVTYDDMVNIPGLSFGVVVRNIGPQMTFDGPGLNIEAISSSLSRGSYYYKVEPAGFELPTSLELGLGYKIPLAEEHGLLVATSFQNNNFSDDEYKVGVEYDFNHVFLVRGGYDYSPPATDRRENIFGPSFGAGVHTLLGSVDVRFDYAFRSTKVFNNNHVFSVTLGL